jgi:hypothetical protein
MYIDAFRPKYEFRVERSTGISIGWRSMVSMELSCSALWANAMWKADRKGSDAYGMRWAIESGKLRKKKGAFSQ